MRNVGTIVRGIRTPIIKENDDLVSIVVDSVLEAAHTEPFEFYDKDVIAITEAVVGISQGNYVTVDQIATDIRAKFPVGNIGITFPILSRNRFSMILKAIARGSHHITMLLSYPADEVGNHLFDDEQLDVKEINPYSDVLSETRYEELFGHQVHTFTGVNYVDYYRELVTSENCEIEFVFGNDVTEILKYTKHVLTCDIHTREQSKQKLKKNGALTVLGLDDILTSSVEGSGHNETYGLLGSNKSTEERLKLFPRAAQPLVDEIQKRMQEKTGKLVEVMIYGDGAFKDPVGKIWELADPVVSPFHTSGLEGTPNEIKLKYISDNQFGDLHGNELNEAIKAEIRSKSDHLKGTNATLGTTPRRITDLLGSLCDLTSGSGDKGTPVVLVQRYFSNYADQ